MLGAPILGTNTLTGLPDVDPSFMARWNLANTFTIKEITSLIDNNIQSAAFAAELDELVEWRATLRGSFACGPCARKCLGRFCVTPSVIVQKLDRSADRWGVHWGLFPAMECSKFRTAS